MCISAETKIILMLDWSLSKLHRSERERKFMGLISRPFALSQKLGSNLHIGGGQNLVHLGQLRWYPNKATTPKCRLVQFLVYFGSKDI